MKKSFSRRIISCLLLLFVIFQPTQAQNFLTLNDDSIDVQYRRGTGTNIGLYLGVRVIPAYENAAENTKSGPNDCKFRNVTYSVGTSGGGGSQKNSGIPISQPVFENIGTYTRLEPLSYDGNLVKVMLPFEYNAESNFKDASSEFQITPVSEYTINRTETNELYVQFLCHDQSLPVPPVSDETDFEIIEFSDDFKQTYRGIYRIDKYINNNLLSKVWFIDNSFVYYPGEVSQAELYLLIMCSLELSETLNEDGFYDILHAHILPTHAQWPVWATAHDQDEDDFLSGYNYILEQNGQSLVTKDDIASYLYFTHMVYHFAEMPVNEARFRTPDGEDLSIPNLDPYSFIQYYPQYMDEENNEDGIIFNGQYSFDPDGENLTYEWLFEDKTIETSDANFRLKFSEPSETGTLVVLKVTDESGNFSTDTVVVPYSEPVDDLPAKAARPSGDVVICNTASSYQYITEECDFANSYSWQIIPASAGVIVEQGTEATINWSASYTGYAEISVSGSNYFGNGETSDILSVFIGAVEEKASVSEGKSELCQNASNTLYMTNGVDGASSYNWLISPIEAGTVIGNDAEAIVDWSETFTGQVELYVRGTNECGEGPLSDAFIVTILPGTETGTPALPVGETSFCINPDNSTYTTTGAESAISYEWTIIPSEAGTISGTDVTAEVDWSDTYVGIAEIYVSGKNNCGVGPSSNILAVEITGLPEKAAQLNGEEELCTVPSNTTYSTTGAEFASSYEWTLSPSEAGIISGGGVTVEIDWSDSYTGIAELFVTGKNNCGTGEPSDVLTINIMDLPGKAGTPDGITELELNPENSIYTTTGVTGAEFYIWEITPATAGVFTGDGTSVELDWTNTFTGNAEIIVTGENRCGLGTSSEPINVTVINTTFVENIENNSFVNIYPNPFTNKVCIGFKVASLKFVDIRIFNQFGQHVKTLTHQEYKNGDYNIYWDGTDDQNSQLSPGVYYCRIRKGNMQEVWKMVFIK